MACTSKLQSPAEFEIAHRSPLPMKIFSIAFSSFYFIQDLWHTVTIVTVKHGALCLKLQYKLCIIAQISVGDPSRNRGVGRQN